jgi:hypothetical protein
MVSSVAPDVPLTGWEHIPAPVGWHCCTASFTITDMHDHQCSTIDMKDAPR